MIYFDFEYRDNKVRGLLVSVSVLKEGEEERNYWFQGDEAEKGIEAFKSFYLANQEDTWVCYSADADYNCLMTLGLPRPGGLIDLMPESLNITLTHPRYFSANSGLLAQLHTFGILSTLAGQVAKVEKNTARDVILNNINYSPSQKEHILNYGKDDTMYLPQLLQAIEEVHDNWDTDVTRDHMLDRGHFLILRCELEHASPGMPVNKAAMDRVYDNASKLREGLALKLNEEIGIEFFQWKGPKKDPKRDGLVFKYESFAKYIEQLGITEDWQRTETGKLSLEDKYIKKQGEMHAGLCSVREAKQFLREVSDKPTLDPRRHLNKRGGHYYTPMVNIPFAQKSSRTSPKPARGFILNRSPWQRNAFIQAPKGKCIIIVDYKGQETAIQASVSKDKKLRDMYNTPDIYLAMAEEGNQIPSGWKDDLESARREYFLQRMVYKAVMLGLGFGLGYKALGLQLYLLYRENKAKRISQGQAVAMGADLYDWHHQTFSSYWEWVKRNWAIFRGQYFLKLPGGWTYFGDGFTRETQVQNIPIQYRGAKMIRSAMMEAHALKLDGFICSLHDSLSCLSNKKDVEMNTEKLRSAMTIAGQKTIGDFCPVTLGNADIYTHKKHPYHDLRGDAMLGKIEELLK